MLRIKYLMKVLESHRDEIESSIGVTIGEALGHGKGGIVFKTSDPSKVFKISVDPCEGPIWQLLMDNLIDDMQGVAKCYHLSMLMEMYDDPDGVDSEIYILLRENILPMKYKHFKSRPKDEQLAELYDAESAMHRYDDASLKFIDHDRTKKSKKEFNNTIQELHKHDLTKALAEVIDAAGNIGIVFADLHFGNIGHRLYPKDDFEYGLDSPWVIFDPGFSSYKGKVKVRDLFKSPVMEEARTNVPKAY